MFRNNMLHPSSWQMTVELLFSYCNDADSRFLCNAGTHVPELTASCSINHRHDSIKPQCKNVTIRIHIKIRVKEISFIVHLHFVVFRITDNAEAHERQTYVNVYNEPCIM